MTTHRHDYLGHYVAELDQVIDLGAIRNAGPRLGVDPPGGAGVHYWTAIAERWKIDLTVGKTVVSAQLIDRVAARLDRRPYEVPVGFKWFSQGLLAGRLGFGGEESVGAAFLRRDGRVWTTDKDGMTVALLSADITARRGRDRGALYLELAGQLGSPFAERIEAPATPEQKARLTALSPQQIGAA